jgi:hypothetical protein
VASSYSAQPSRPAARCPLLRRLRGGAFVCQGAIMLQSSSVSSTTIVT